MACRGARLPTLGPCAGQSRPNAEGIFGESEDSAPECTSRPATPPHRCTRLPGGRGPPPATARVPSSQDATTVGSRAHVAAARETLGEKPGLFTPAEVSFVRSHANRINDLRLDKKVPCHGDYTSQNWLVDAFDTLRVIDFGASRRAIAASDFSQLFFGAWWRRPDLEAVFFEGYGRPLAEHELEFIRLRMGDLRGSGHRLRSRARNSPASGLRKSPPGRPHERSPGAPPESSIE